MFPFLFLCSGHGPVDNPGQNPRHLVTHTARRLTSPPSTPRWPASANVSEELSRGVLLEDDSAFHCPEPGGGGTLFSRRGPSPARVQVQPRTGTGPAHPEHFQQSYFQDRSNPPAPDTGEECRPYRPIPKYLLLYVFRELDERPVLVCSLISDGDCRAATRAARSHSPGSKGKVSFAAGTAP